MTTDDLYKLLAEQNELLKIIVDKPISYESLGYESQEQRFARLADTWDKRQGAVGRLLWRNPYRK
jgi:hypothetical protein